ncbi:hypothetical protein H480_41250 [Amycolatopsis vancoresmycina DSM 44592]|uniref:Uncharacterized protein n=1 Tax=Amycolatopsis vancoresmycina DSM 44592 TaxID=1292037 RepID=R1HHD0_9PSEU|nr:hypothetical protein H480_41250 [Amycolatopsis vancoresmycina DSM 44592]
MAAGLLASPKSSSSAPTSSKTLPHQPGNEPNGTPPPWPSIPPKKPNPCRPWKPNRNEITIRLAPTTMPVTSVLLWVPRAMVAVMAGSSPWGLLAFCLRVE